MSKKKGGVKSQIEEYKKKMVEEEREEKEKKKVVDELKRKIYASLLAKIQDVAKRQEAKDRLKIRKEEKNKKKEDLFKTYREQEAKGDNDMMRKLKEKMRTKLEREEVWINTLAKIKDEEEYKKQVDERKQKRLEDKVRRVAQR